MDIETLMQNAEDLSLSDKNDGALEIYDQILAQEPDHPETLIKRGTLFYSRLDKFQAAMRDFDRYIELNPSSPQGYIERASLFRWVYFESSDVTQLRLSIDDITKAIELGEHDFGGQDEDDFADDTFFQRGSAYWELGEWESAFHDLSRVLDAGSDTSTCYAMRGRAGYETRRFDLALSDLDHAMQDDDDEPENTELRNKILRALGRPEASKEGEKTAERPGAESTQPSPSSKWWWPW